MKYVFAKYGPSEQAASNSSKEDLLEYYVHQPTRDPAASRSLDTNSSLEPNKEWRWELRHDGYGCAAASKDAERGIRVERKFQRTEEQV